MQFLSLPGLITYDKIMSQQLSDLLSERDYNEPPEIQLIKRFVQKAIGITPKVSIRSETYIIMVSSAAAAGSLRPHLSKLQQQLDTSRRLIIRIG